MVVVGEAPVKHAAEGAGKILLNSWQFAICYKLLYIQISKIKDPAKVFSLTVPLTQAKVISTFCFSNRPPIVMQ